MRAVHIISWIARVALMVTLVLGMVAVFTRGLRLLGVGSIVYALIVLAFGLTQDMILEGNLYWLTQAAHLLVGIGAMALVLVIDKRYRRLWLAGREKKREGKLKIV